MLDPCCHILCAPFKPEQNCVQSFSSFLLTYVPKYNHFFKARLFIQVGHKAVKGERPHEVQIVQKKKQKKEEEEEKTSKRHVLVFALDFGLLFCEANSSRVLFIYMNIL